MYYSIQKNTSIGYTVFRKENIEEVVSFFENEKPLTKEELETLENGREVYKYIYGDTYIIEKEFDEIPEERVFDDSCCGIDLDDYLDDLL